MLAPNLHCVDLYHKMGSIKESVKESVEESIKESVKECLWLVKALESWILVGQCLHRFTTTRLVTLASVLIHGETFFILTSVA